MTDYWVRPRPAVVMGKVEESNTGWMSRIQGGGGEYKVEEPNTRWTGCAAPSPWGDGQRGEP